MRAAIIAYVAAGGALDPIARAAVLRLDQRPADGAGPRE